MSVKWCASVAEHDCAVCRSAGKGSRGSSGRKKQLQDPFRSTGDYDITTGDYDSHPRHDRNAMFGSTSQYDDYYPNPHAHPLDDVSPGYGRMPVSKLPPLDSGPSSTSKKKKKKKQVDALVEDERLQLDPDDAYYFN